MFYIYIYFYEKLYFNKIFFKKKLEKKLHSGEAELRNEHWLVSWDQGS